jgi:hypothetical protein
MAVTDVVLLSIGLERGVVGTGVIPSTAVRCGIRWFVGTCGGVLTCNESIVGGAESSVDRRMPTFARSSNECQEVAEGDGAAGAAEDGAAVGVAGPM